MNILVLGASNSSGDLLANRGDGWPWLLAKTLPLDVFHRRFYVTHETYLDFLDRQLREHPADAVILFPATVFSAATTVNAVSDRFGARAGRIVLRIRGLLLRPRVYRALPFAHAGARWLARRAFGSEPGLHQPEASARYAKALERLSGLKTQLVIVMGGCRFDERFHAANPHAQAEIDRFNAVLRTEAYRHGFVWLDTEAMISADGTRRPVYFEHDMLHFGPDEHALIAEAVRPHLERLLTPPAYPSVLLPD